MDSRTFASSLPPHFRYTPDTPGVAALPFFNPVDDDDHLHPVQTVDDTPPKTRLEVLKGWEVSFTVLCLYAASFLALIYVVLKLRFFADHWRVARAVPGLAPPEAALRLLLDAAAVVLPVFFGLSLLLAPAVTDEQLWTLILLIVGLCATNPLTGPMRIPDPAPGPALVINDAVYTAVVYLYLALAAHSYRVFSVRNIHTAAFYLPKLAAAALYLLVKLVAGFKAGVSLGLIPYSRLLTWLLLERSGRSSLHVTIPVLLTTLLDTAFGFWLVHEVAATAEFLATVPYVEHRAKQLGFRCFVYQTLAFCFNMIGLSLLTTYMLPRDYLYAAFDNPPAHLLQLEPPVARLGLAFVYCTWTLVLAYVNLPAAPLLPFAQQLVSRALFLVRNSRVAVWLGLADIVNTEDAEDSDDGTEMTPLSRADSRAPPTIPLRYRHREVFDDVLLSPQLVQPISPLVLPDRFPGSSLRGVPAEICEDISISRSREMSLPIAPTPIRPVPVSAYIGSQPIEILDASPRSTYPPAFGLLSPDEPETVANLKRLRLRKNLFVMETAVLMVNASYLSYIPGNPKEERVKMEKACSEQAPLLHTGSLSTDLDDLARQIEEENRMIYAAAGKEFKTEREQPDRDDGTMFLVDPYEMAERYGYKVHKYLSNETWNTHALVLTNSTRVVVAFSGTRDVTNWGVNANIKRAVLDEKLSRFEYELSGDEQQYSNAEQSAEELSLETFDFRTLGGKTSRDRRRAVETSPLRRSMSEERLAEKVEGERLGRRKRVGKSVPRRTKYGTVETTADEGDLGGSRTGHGVSMVASAFAKELLTFGQPKVHEGFIEAYMSLRKQVMGTLMELYRGPQVRGGKSSPPDGTAKSLPLFFCGHSLGGAMATFASYESARYYKRIGISRRQDVSCTTFGCPQIGNEAFKARYERLVETHWRFELAADPIPRVSTVFLNYVPVGVQILIDQSGMLLIDPSFIEVQWWGQLANLYLGYRLHIRASYCMALKTYCKLYKTGADDLADKFWPFPIKAQTKGLFRHAQQ